MPHPRSDLTEAQTRAALAAFDAIGGLERSIAAQPWKAVPTGSTEPEPEPFQGWRFRVEPVSGGVRVSVSMGRGEPAAWFVLAR